MDNRKKLQDLVIEVFLLDPAEFRFDLTRDEVDTWDSLGVVALAVGLHDTFGYHLEPEEATSIRSIQDAIDLLTTKGISFG